MMELMREAALNTVLGMGMTFLVLILLSGIITLFGRGINAFQNRKVPERTAPAAAEPVPETKAVVPEAPKAPAAGDSDLMAVLAAAVAAYESDTMSPEIAAVIAAAVAAYEGPGNGFVVRKIRKSRRHAG